MRKLDWAMVGAIILLFTLCMMVAMPHKAHAHDPVTHQPDNLAEAKSLQYGSCCIGDDYQKIRVEEWETTETGWRVLHKGKWLDVPKLAKVSNMDNPDGEAKAWIFGEGDSTYVRCFMAGTQS